MRRVRTVAQLIVLLGVSVAACGTPSESEPPAARDGIALDDDPYDWEPDPEPPPVNTGGPCTNSSVAAIRDHNGAILCSAVVLASDLLLTNGHCVLTQNGQLDPETANLSVATGATACKHGPSTITGVLKHPQFQWGSGTDLAVVSVNPPLSGATAATFGTAAAGATVTMTGYGNTTATGGGGTERCLNGTVSSVGGSLGMQINFGTGQACEGDSGGAVFQSGTSRLVGVLYGGTTANCSSTGLAAIDLAFAQDAVANRPKLAKVSCQAGTYSPCLREGRTCPTNSLWCQFDQRKCADDGTWGVCQARGAPDPCLTGTTWDQSKCECVPVTGGGSGGSGGGGFGGAPACNPCPTMGCYRSFSCGYQVSCSGSCQPGFKCLSGECKPETMYW